MQSVSNNQQLTNINFLNRKERKVLRKVRKELRTISFDIDIDIEIDIDIAASFLLAKTNQQHFHQSLQFVHN